MLNKIKAFLREIFAPRVIVTHNYYSKDIKPEDWKKIGGDFDKVFEDMDKVFKSMDNLFKKL
jgi:hypothetical protein